MTTTPSLTPLPIPNALDMKLIEQCDSSVRVRRLLELAVVRHACAALIAAGRSITVDDGEDEPVVQGTDVDAIVDAAFAVDECWLYIHQHATDKEPYAWIFLVFGNDGWDVINDHTTNLEESLKATNEYAEALSAWC